MKLALIVLGILFVLGGVFYLVPGVSHPFVSSDPTGMHFKHAGLLILVGLVAFVGSRFVGQKA